MNDLVETVSENAKRITDFDIGIGWQTWGNYGSWSKWALSYKAVLGALTDTKDCQSYR